MNRQLMCGAALVALCAAFPANAQQGDAQQGDAQQGQASGSAQTPVTGTQTPLGGVQGLQLAPSEPTQLRAETKERDRADIVVTGTLIRGVAPAGTETVRITADDIKAVPGVSTNDVLAQVPQITNFFNSQVVTPYGTASQTNTPQIHGLPSLMLLDGHRIVAGGTVITGVDADLIPKGVLDSIEVVPDGGSALYGSDAVGGTINLNTKKRFDGIDIAANVGFANSYRTTRFDGTFGKAWSNGSIYIAYAYQSQSALFGSSRPYVQRIPGLTECSPNTTVKATIPYQLGGLSISIPIGTYSYPGVGANGKPTGYTTGGASCNEYTNESLLPSVRMNSVFAGLTQDFSPSIRADLRAYYTTKKSKYYDPDTTYTDATVPSSNAYYTMTPSFEAYIPGGAQSVGISFAPAVGAANYDPSRIDNFGASAEFTADVGGGFQIRLLGNYSHAYVSAITEGIDGNLLTKALASSDPATALDPYNVTITPQSAQLARQIDGEHNISTGKSDEWQGRLVTDGKLFRLPGGDVKIAVGGEVLSDQFNAIAQELTYDNQFYQPTRLANAKRTVTSAFGELEIPMISAMNQVPLLYGLHVSVAGRYDHYSDFGGTFNPRLAASLMPTSWFTIRSTFGHSFVAPTLSQEYAVNGTATVATANSFILTPALFAANQGRNVIVVTGGNANLKPQKARTWTLGADLKLPFAPGFKASVTYYNANYDNQISTPPFTQPSLFYSPAYASFYQLNPTLAQAQAIVGNVPVNGNGFTSLAQLYATPGAAPADIIDDRFANLAQVKTSGLDFDVGYRHPSPIGALSFQAAGTFLLTNTTSASPGQPATSQLPLLSHFMGSLNVGDTIGKLRINATLLHTSGYGLSPGSSLIGNQTWVKSYDTVNAFIGYTVTRIGVLAGTQFSVNIQNLFDVRPPYNSSETTGYYGGSYIGRSVQLGIEQKF